MTRPAGRSCGRFLRLWSFLGDRRESAGRSRSLGAGERGRGRRDAPGGRDQALPSRHVSYRPWLGEQVLRQMRGLPAGGFDLLVQVLARICEDPYDRLAQQGSAGRRPDQADGRARRFRVRGVPGRRCRPAGARRNPRLDRLTGAGQLTRSRSRPEPVVPQLSGLRTEGPSAREAGLLTGRSLTRFPVPRPRAARGRHPRPAPVIGTASRRTRPDRPATTIRPGPRPAAGGHPGTSGSGPASFRGLSGTAPLARAAGPPRRSTRPHWPGRRAPRRWPGPRSASSCPASTRSAADVADALSRAASAPRPAAVPIGRDSSRWSVSIRMAGYHLQADLDHIHAA